MAVTLQDGSKEVADTKRVAGLILGALLLTAGCGPAYYVPPKSVAPSAAGGAWTVLAAGVTPESLFSVVDFLSGCAPGHRRPSHVR